jgi:hypothetical protein
VAELEIGRLAAFISIRSKWQCEVGGSRSKCARAVWAVLAVRGCVECWGAEFEVVVATEREVGPGVAFPTQIVPSRGAVKLPQQHLQSLTTEAVRKRGCDSAREAET